MYDGPMASMEEIQVGDVVLVDPWDNCMVDIDRSQAYQVVDKLNHSYRIVGMRDHKPPIYYDGTEATISPYWLKRDKFLSHAAKAIHGRKN